MVSVEIGEWLPAPAQAMRPAFAIGDVHGRDDLFGPLVEAIEGIVLQDSLSDALLVALGDYIDRGPTGIKALKRALDGWENQVLSFVALPGNHEQFLCAFLSCEDHKRANICALWFYNGGTYVARELGFDPTDIQFETFSRGIIRALGDERLDRFLAMGNHVRLGRYLFVHAGIHPHLGLSMLDRDWCKLPQDSTEEELDPLWIRGPFLNYNGEHEDGVIVVHGHTPTLDVELRSNRIGIDTWAYDTGRLTAVQLLGAKLRFIRAIGG